MDSTDPRATKTDLQKNQFGARIKTNPNPVDEKELLERIKTNVKEEQTRMQELRDSAEQDEAMYYARYVDPKRLRKGEDNVMVPKLFENWETLIPIITRTTPEPNVTVVEKEMKKSIIKSFVDMVMRPKKKTRAKLQELMPWYLKDKWQLAKIDGGAYMQVKMEENFRNLATQRVMIFKMRWNKKFKVLEPVVISVNDCIFAKDTEDDSELQFFGHYCIYTLGELRKMKVPEEKLEKLMELVGAKTGKKVSDKTEIKLMEYWECENVCLQYDEKLILTVFQNPLYNWEDEKFNHFDMPLIPFVVETDLKQNSGLIGNSSYIQIAKSLVENVDKRKKQINRNMKLVNGFYVVDGRVISKENSRNMATDADKTIWMKPNKSGITADQAVKVITANPISQAVVEDMLHSESHIDKVTGVNETIRGERTAQETAEGRKLLKESALSRNEILFRVNERIGQKFFNWTIQAMYVYCAKEGYPIYTSGADSTKSGLITKDMLEGSKILCYVKDGSTIPVDKSTVEAEAFERFKAGAYSLLKYLRIIGDPDPEGTAKEVYLEKTDPAQLYDKSQSANQYDPLAIIHIYDLIKGENDVPLAPMDDMKVAEKHLMTQDSYIAGEDVDQGDLPKFDELDTEIRRRIIQHTQDEAKKIAELVASGQVQPPVPPMQPGMGAPMDPALMPPPPMDPAAMAGGMPPVIPPADPMTAPAPIAAEAPPMV